MRTGVGNSKVPSKERGVWEMEDFGVREEEERGVDSHSGSDVGSGGSLLSRALAPKRRVQMSASNSLTL